MNETKLINGVERVKTENGHWIDARNIELYNRLRNIKEQDINEFKYTINDIFTFPTGTRFKDQEGNTYKIFEDKYGFRTLKYPIVTEKMLNNKFKIVK